MPGPLRIVVLGSVGRHPYGGQTWMHLHWLRGFAGLGHDVVYVEDSSTWPYDPVLQARPTDCLYTRRYLESVLADVGLAERWVLRVEGLEGACWGRTEAELESLYASCDLLLNLAGGVPDERQRAARLCVWLQTDPVTAELRLAAGDEATKATFTGHDAIATYGENYGAADCGVPMNGFEYLRTHQPVDLTLWPATFDPDAESFTTIGSYRQLGWDVTFDGTTYRWSKHHEWEGFLGLPAATGQRFELALSSLTADDQRRLETHGWNVRPAFDVSLDPWSYRAFIAGSRAAFTVAKDQNIRLRSGWFSEREACYLATGKPVVTQDTGFGTTIPTGDGLFAINDVDGAVAAIDTINRDYEHHCQAARAIAEQHLDARAVCGRLLADLGLAAADR